MKLAEKFILLLIVFLGFTFRIYNINWDQACCQHPDERAIVMFALPISLPGSIEEFFSPESPLNPHFFAYGNFPIYLLKGTSEIVSYLNPVFATYDRINLVGRFISVIVDCATIIVIFMLTKSILNKKIGYASSLIYAVSVLPIQNSHFYTVDILLTFVTSLTMLLTIFFYRHPTIVNSILLGAVFGLALAVKFSALLLIILIAVPIVINPAFSFLKNPLKVSSWLPEFFKSVNKFFPDCLLVFTTSAVTFLILQPYALIDFKEFFSQTMHHAQMGRDPYVFPYTLQYVDKVRYFYELKNIFLWGLGPIISILSISGMFIIFAGFKKIKENKRFEMVIISAFGFLYFLIVGGFAVGWMRYLLPIYPILAIFGGIALVSILMKIAEIKNTFIKRAAGILILILIIIWPASFISIYSNLNTRIEATLWINENIPEESSIAIEHWDDRIPMWHKNVYYFNELTLYNQPDDKNKWNLLSEKLESSDYLIIASNRLYAPIQKLSNCKKNKKCYPIASDYYKRLFAGETQFKKIAIFDSNPTVPVLNLEIDDQGADESFTVYDHPKVFIFKKSK